MKHIPVVALAALILAPLSLSAQQLGIAARAGTIGVGVEGAVGLADRLVIRGGIGFLPLEVDPTSLWDLGEGISTTLKLPDKWYNAGVDLYLGSTFRIGGGMLFKPDDPTISGTLTASASIDIGGQTYTVEDVAGITGKLVSKARAPYVLIGFGKHTSSGIGFFLDLGMVLLGDPDVQLTATGNSSLINSSDFESRLRTEEQSLENKAGTYLKYWPIVNLGLRVGIGG
jgi:hypothetical protein